MDCSPPGSSVHGTLQARIPQWVAHALFQGIFLTQGSNRSLLHCRRILYHLSHQGSPLNFSRPNEISLLQSFKGQTRKLHFTGIILVCQLQVGACGICHLPLRRLNPVLMPLPTFNTPWGECRVESEALCAPGKLVDRSLVRYFQELISWPQTSHLFVPRKAQNPCMVISAPHE